MVAMRMLYLATPLLAAAALIMAVFSATCPVLPWIPEQLDALEAER